MKHYKRLFFLFFLSIDGNEGYRTKTSKIIFYARTNHVLKKRIETDTEVRKNWEEALAVAKHQLEKPDLDKIDYLSLAT
jgi:hypothetical protein